MLHDNQHALARYNSLFDNQVDTLDRARLHHVKLADAFTEYDGTC